MLGDVTHDDWTYTGEDAQSPMSIQFYRNKANEFQAIMESVAVVRVSAESILGTLYDLPDDSYANVLAIIEEIDAKKPYIVAAAQAINLASETANAAGLRFPMLSTPGTLLGGFPFLAVAGVIAGAASLAYWGHTIVNRYADQMQSAQLLASATPGEARDRVALELSKAMAAKNHADNPVSAMAGAVKWVAIAGVVYLAWRAYDHHSHSKG